MIALDYFGTGNQIEMVLAGAITTNPVEFDSSFAEFNVSGIVTSQWHWDGVSNNTTAAIVVPSTGTSGYLRVVKGMSFFNADTAAVTITVRRNRNATLRTIAKVVLQPGEHLFYEEGRGWFVMEVDGVIR